MIKILIGDMFASDADTLVNTVNCEGVMGKGVALDFKKRFPDMFKEYVSMCKQNLIRPGHLTLYSGLFDRQKVINFPTKKHWRSPALLRDIEAGLEYFLDNYKKWGIKKIAFPPLGCGNGGLNWSAVGPLMYQKLKNIDDLDIEVYAPFGTNKDYLSIQYLEENSGAFSASRGENIRSALRPSDILVVETLYRLQNRVYAKPIGRIMFQKACYILTEAGAPTGFRFVENMYGPYSIDAKQTLLVLANNNLTKEEQIGTMLKTTIDEHYDVIRSEYMDVVLKNEFFINKAVDLLSRIKNTDQGEEVATVMYATKQVTQNKKEIPSDTEVIEYIYDWKKKWKDNEDKERALFETFLNLNMLGWINVRLSRMISSSDFVF